MCEHLVFLHTGHCTPLEFIFGSTYQTSKVRLLSQKKPGLQL